MNTEKERLPEAEEHFHGSDLEKIEKYFGIPKEKITAFGANVNPLGISPRMRRGLASHIDVITTYPDPDYTELRRHIAAYAGCRPEEILVGNGCTELISLFIQIHQPQKALIVSPTYSEYEREVVLAGGTVEYYELQESRDFLLDTGSFCRKLRAGKPQICVICNPNNPTSTAVLQDDMRTILDCCREEGIFVMIDETYAEFAPEKAGVSAVGLLEEYKNFAVLRGVSKFFAAPGLRLGYAMTSDLKLLELIRERKNPWTLNSLADAAGSLMFTDREYIEQTRELIFTERERVYRELSSWKSVKVYRPWANFILVRILKKGVTASDVFLHAIRRGLMLRDCSSFPGLEDGSFFRFCFMTPEKNTELTECLKEILG